MMIYTAAVVRTHIEFTLIQVPEGTIDSLNRHEFMKSVPLAFTRPIVIAETRANNKFKLYGHKKDVRTVMDYGVTYLPWEEYTFNVD